MRILFVNPRVPYPPDNGEKLHSYHILRNLAKRHTIDFVAFSDGPEDERNAAHLRSICNQIHLVKRPSHSKLGYLMRFALNALSAKPWMVAAHESQPMRDLLLSLVKQNRYDVVQLELLWLAQYAAELRPLLQGGLIALTDHNVEAEVYRSMAQHSPSLFRRLHSKREEQRVWAYERKMWNEMDLVIGVSTADVATVSRNTKSAVQLAPVGVDSEYLYPGDGPEEPNTLVFVGSLHYPPNADGVHVLETEILPRVRRQIPDVKAYVVGKGLPQTEGRHDPGMVLTGYVADFRPFVHKAAVYVVPLRMGGGIRVKVLEAMALGKAIVATAIGAGGVDCKHGEDIFIADDMDEFARHVVELLRDPALRQRFGGQARENVCRLYNWESITLGLEARYAEVLGIPQKAGDTP